MALNLDTSDGHVMWWGHALWTDANLFGNVATPFASDFKGEWRVACAQRDCCRWQAPAVST